MIASGWRTFSPMLAACDLWLRDIFGHGSRALALNVVRYSVSNGSTASCVNCWHPYQDPRSNLTTYNQKRAQTLKFGRGATKKRPRTRWKVIASSMSTWNQDHSLCAIVDQLCVCVCVFLQGIAWRWCAWGVLGGRWGTHLDPAGLSAWSIAGAGPPSGLGSLKLDTRKCRCKHILYMNKQTLQHGVKSTENLLCFTGTSSGLRGVFSL